MKKGNKNASFHFGIEKYISVLNDTQCNLDI